MKRWQRRTALVAVALLVAACGRSADREDGAGDARPSSTGDRPAAVADASFGTLGAVCGPGAPTTSPAPGVTDRTITVSVFSDAGYDQRHHFEEAAQVFTSWCNDLGGVNGRQLRWNARDARLTEARQRMIEACEAGDFAVVGGGAGLDQASVRERLSCLMPEFPAQVTSPEATGADLQVAASERIVGANPYESFYRWLVDEAHPDSKGAIGILAADIPLTKSIGEQNHETLTALGATVVYNDLYARGIPDYTPYAQAIKAAGVQGLIIMGSIDDAAAIERALSDIGYRPAWIDPTSRGHSEEFVELTKDFVDRQNNVISLNTHPFEVADQYPASRKMMELYEHYAPNAKLTSASYQAFSAWLQFVVAASACGEDLTRRCVWEQGMSQTRWDGGGLIAARDPSANLAVDELCFTAVRLTSAGFEPADVGADASGFRCEPIRHPYQKDYGKPLRLADVGRSLDELE